MKACIFSIIFIELLFLLFTQDCMGQPDSTNSYVEIFPQHWFSTSYCNDIPKFIAKGHFQEGKIIVHNKKFINAFQTAFNRDFKPSKCKRKELDYKCVVIYHNKESQDTIAFENFMEIMEINSKLYEFDWGLFNLIISKFPAQLKTKAEESSSLNFNSRDECEKK